MKKLFSLAAVTSFAAFAATPAQAATLLSGNLDSKGIANYVFQYDGVGGLDILVESAGASPVGDPEIFLFANDATGALIASNDDILCCSNLNSFINPLGQAAGTYFAVVGRFNIDEAEARAGDNAGNGAGTTFNITFGSGISAIRAPDAGAVPEPATWALMLLGFGAVGFAMRRRSRARVAVSYA